MKERVLITVAGTEKTSGETIETMAAGTCVQTQAGWRIEYDDELLTEEERGLPQHNVLFLERESVRMIRTGGMKSDMRFLPGRKEACQYETPYGALSLSTFTEDLAVEISENEIAARISYSLWMQEECLSEHRVEILVRNPV